MVKVVAYLCHQCCFIDNFSEFGEFSSVTGEQCSRETVKSLTVQLIYLSLVELLFKVVGKIV